MLATQLELFDNSVASHHDDCDRMTTAPVKIVEKNGITMFQCDLDFTRWITPGTPCPMCQPSQDAAVCDKCGSAFEDDRAMLEHMRIGGRGVRCDLCLPRITPDDCRDQNELAREAEERRLNREAQRQAAGKRRAMFDVADDE